MRVEARLVCVVLSHIEARLVCATGLYALSPLDFSASIRDGLVCDLGFYPRLYGISSSPAISSLGCARETDESSFSQEATFTW